MSIHEITLVPISRVQDKIQKQLENVDVETPDYANVYYSGIEKYHGLVAICDALQQISPMETVLIPTRLDLQGATLLVYTQYSDVYTVKELSDELQEFFDKFLVKGIKSLNLEVSDIRQVYTGKRTE